EAPKGSLRMVGNHSHGVKAQGSLTARPTSRAGTKVGLSDPVVPHGRAIAQRIKATPGITGLSPPRVHIDGEVWHLDVGSSHPGADVGPKGWAVRPLKRYASSVQNVVRQFGPYLSRAQHMREEPPLVREVRGARAAGVRVVPRGGPLGSAVGKGQALIASRRVASLKMRFATHSLACEVRAVEDDGVDRSEV